MSTLKTRVLHDWTAGAVIGSVVEAGGTAYTAIESSKQGDNFGTTLGKVAFDIGVNAILQGGWANAAYFGATVAWDMMLAASTDNAELQKQMKYTGSGRMGSGYFNMSGAGYTMRQRAINQLRANGQNVNAVLGNEARNYIKSSQNYT